MGEVVQRAPRRQGWLLIGGFASINLIPVPALQALAATPAGAIEMSIRRLPDAVELVIGGVGAAPQLRQSGDASRWEAQIATDKPGALKFGPQRLAMPELGLQLVSLQGAGSTYQVEITATPGLPLRRPTISADGQNLIIAFAAPFRSAQQTGRLDLNQPGSIPQPGYVPPLRPRAVAPPLGDMAVGSMVLRNTALLQVKGPRVTLTLRNAPAKDALMALAQIGGYGFVYVDPDGEGPASSPAPRLRAVTIAFKNETYPRALNAVLLAAGLQGRLEGNLIMAGPSLAGKGFSPQMSKVYRLNQVSPNSAADYLANLGATVTKINTITTAVTQGVAQANAVAAAPIAQTTQLSAQTSVESFGAPKGPLLGLQATTDPRLGTVTLIGDSGLIVVAEQYLRQLDLRQRQVALAVKILDVNLNNDTNIANSFAFRFGNNFIVNDSGKFLGSFGNGYPASTPAVSQPSDGSFVDYLRASIVSSNTKLLASPTLILSENPEPIEGGAEVAAATSAGGPNGVSSSLSTASIGRPRANESFVTVGTNVVTAYSSNQTTGSNSSNIVTCTPGFGISGLTLGARVSKIDDNGFVTFTLSPAISAATSKTAVQGCGEIQILSVRRLDTGTVRVRDGQTLILTGVISDSDISTVTKWPILGDIPLIGQFFRNSGRTRDKRELVIMVTPKVINDESGGVFGFGYQPSSSQAREWMGQATGY
ncbi:general secretion pathway protein GspD [Cyanobium sp. WAJ14-Wanaka]|nr:general secretion pathway protein GspD [Cyanobium sp. WAJ14-Wanaka]